MTSSRRVLIVGSGAIGLRTAVELLRKRISVAIFSPSSPLSPENCSQGAGGLWMPFHCEDPRVDRWAIETLDELHPMAIDKTNDLVEAVPCVGLRQEHAGPTIEDFKLQTYKNGGDSLPSWTKDARLDFQHLTAEMLEWQNSVFGYRIPSQEILLKDGYKHAWLWKSPIVNSPKMLTHLMQEVEQSEFTIDCDVNTGKWYTSIQEILDVAKSMDCDTVINCTGLGARALCGDQELVGARGILLHFDRATAQRTYPSPIETPIDAAIFAEDGPWGTETEPCYLIPRGDVLVVGGSYLEGDDRESMTEQERQRLLQNARRLGIDVDASPPISEWTGHRPARPTTQCRVDESVSDVKFIHSYGHGGSGWTVNVGVAKETVHLLNLVQDQ